MQLCHIPSVMRYRPVGNLRWMLLLFAACLYCQLGNAQDKGQDALFKVLRPVSDCSYPVASHAYMQDTGGECNTLITLDNDSTFSAYKSCEGQGEYAYGTWKAIDDSIELRFKTGTRNDLFCNVQQVGAKAQSIEKTCTLYVRDKSGKPISHLMIMPYNHNTTYSFRTDSDVEGWDFAKSGVKNIYTDSMGKAVLDYNHFDSIELRQLTLLSGRKIKFGFKSKFPEFQINIVLNLDNGLFYDPYLMFAPVNEKVMRYKMLPDKLVNKKGSFNMIR